MNHSHTLLLHTFSWRPYAIETAQGTPLDQNSMAAFHYMSPLGSPMYPKLLVPALSIDPLLYYMLMKNSDTRFPLFPQDKRLFDELRDLFPNNFSDMMYNQQHQKSLGYTDPLLCYTCKCNFVWPAELFGTAPDTPQVLNHSAAELRMISDTENHHAMSVI
jgi:hypothetical protein